MVRLSLRTAMPDSLESTLLLSLGVLPASREKAAAARPVPKNPFKNRLRERLGLLSDMNARDEFLENGCIENQKAK